MTKRTTAAELIAELEKDPGFVAARAKKEKARRRTEATLRAQEAPLLRALLGVGLPLDSVWDLVNDPADHPEAVPVLLEHLSRQYPPEVREGIARALGMPSARDHWSLIVGHYRTEPDSGVKDGLAAALNAIATDNVYEAVVELVRDAANGPSRVLLVGALARSKRPAARSELHRLLEDPDLRKEVDFLLRQRP